jgi:hypothetical protein
VSYSLEDFDPTEDFGLFDGSVTVSYERYVVDDSYESAFYVVCLFRERHNRVIAINNGEAVEEVCVVHFPNCDKFGLNPPKRFDRFTVEQVDTDEETVWIIQDDASVSTLGTRHRTVEVKQHKVNV